jgi:CubicO group peptidase (beta-lactamase class C family)
MDLQEKLTELATELGVPGVVAGVITPEGAVTAVHGVTNVDHPLDVDEHTLFQFGSTGKTVTATAIMVLVEQGKVDLDAPVRTYVPELVLRDEEVAEKVTVLQLLNHTAGWAGDMILELGDGDDCLDRYVAKMAEFEQVAPLGAMVSYNNASLSLAGQVIARVHGTTYEQAVRELVLEPLGLNETYGFAKEIMTKRFSSGHQRHDDGTVTVTTPWGLPRSGTPAGGWTATIGDQLEWARFHLGLPGTTILKDENRLAMQQPTAEMPGNALGDAVGISWLLSEYGGETIVGHGGTTLGQHSDFAMVPARDFGFVCMTNCGPTGAELHHKLRTWALETYLGLTSKEPELAEVTPEQLSEYEGTYVTSAIEARVVVDGALLVVKTRITDESMITEDQTAEQPDILIGLTTDGPDRHMVAEGEAKGLKGYFSRGDDGLVNGFHFGGRYMERIS